MRFALVLNGSSGTLKSRDLADFENSIGAALKAGGHSICRMDDADADLMTRIDHASNSDCDGVIACGGDGTISATASKLAGTDKVLGVLPGGTMNLYARTVGMSLELEDAVRQLADAQPQRADIASANGRYFIHQFAVGFQARAVKLRDKMEFASRLGKMVASTKAIGSVLIAPPNFNTEMILDEGGPQRVRSSVVGVTNNTFGAGHLPYADKLNDGELGLYRAEPMTLSQGVKFLADTALGRLHENDQVTAQSARIVELQFPKRRRSDIAVIDGEIIPLEAHIHLKIHTGKLKVLVPENPVI